MKKYLVELIGTFFLVLTVGCTVVGGVANAPIAIGSALMVMIFAGGHISGAHYNPAVSLGVFLRGKISMNDMIAYMVAQIIGGVVAALVVGFLVGEGKPMELNNTAAVMLAEFLGTFALVYVVLNTATAKGTEGNSFYGLAIGFTVTAMAYALGGVSGGAFNPAVAIGAAAMDLQSISNIWMHIVAELAAAAAAAYAFLYANGKN